MAESNAKTVLFLILVSLASRCAEYQPKKNLKNLTLWIEGKEIEHFVGFPYDIYVIRDGVVTLDYLDIGTSLPVLPPEVHLVQISWVSPNDEYYYRFHELKSLDPNLLYDPMLSIPKTGKIPKTISTFELTIPCIGHESGIASMYLSMGIADRRLFHIPGSPINVHIRKRCNSLADRNTKCETACSSERGRCEEGRCKCNPGYYGLNCQYGIASCFPQCENNGTCELPGLCLCPKDFTGTRCETVICDSGCKNGGSCVEPNVCNCPPHHYGSLCQHAVGSCQRPCLNGGYCTNQNICHCFEGYEGEFCEKVMCTRKCQHGKCVSPETCECEKGWRGKACHKVKRRRRKNNGPYDKLDDWDPGLTAGNKSKRADQIIYEPQRSDRNLSPKEARRAEKRRKRLERREKKMQLRQKDKEEKKKARRMSERAERERQRKLSDSQNTKTQQTDVTRATT